MGAATISAVGGRHTGYIVRQLQLFQNGSRSDPTATLMRGVVKHPGHDGMPAIAAYLASLQP
jgi:cytochrome c553